MHCCRAVYGAATAQSLLPVSCSVGPEAEGPQEGGKGLTFSAEVPSPFLSP